MSALGGCGWVGWAGTGMLGLPSGRLGCPCRTLVLARVRTRTRGCRLAWLLLALGAFGPRPRCLSAVDGLP
jgi:hypothetical protein